MTLDLELKRRDRSSSRRPEKLVKLFNPEGVAVVGVSLEDGEKLGNRILRNIIDSGYSSGLYPVNPKAEEDCYLHGHRIYQSLEEIEENVDVAVVSVPRKAVPSVVKDCGSKDVDFAVVIASGFEESGEEGMELGKDITERAEDNGVTILGPNVLGYVDTDTPINASFSPEFPKQGDVAFLSQSGALGSGVMEKSRSLDIGLSKFVSLGNKSMLDETDFLEYLKDDESSNYVMMYLEEITRGREFIEAAKELSKKKPVLAIKSARTNSGRLAASSHTGSLGSEDDVVEAAMREAGIIRVNDTHELLNTVQLLKKQPLPEGRNLLVVTNAGGEGVMTSDVCATSSLRLVEPKEEIRQRLREKLPEGVSLENPVDVRGDACAERYERVIEEGIEDVNVDSILVLMTRQSGTDPRAIKNRITELERKSDKPILASFFGDGEVDEVVSEIEAGGIPHFSTISSAITSLEKVLRYANWKEGTKENSSLKIDYETPSLAKGEVGGKEALKIMDSWGIATVENMVASTPTEAENIAEEVDGELVMKLESPELSHKSDIGGVKTNVPRERVPEVFRKLERTGKEKGLNGPRVSIQPQLDAEREIIVGGFRHDNFGPLVRVGLGGKYTEVFQDFSTRLAPVDNEEALNMIEETNYASVILNGKRNKDPVNFEILAETIAKISEVLASERRIEELEINPLLFRNKNPVAVDARIRLSDI